MKLFRADKKFDFIIETSLWLLIFSLIGIHLIISFDASPGFWTDGFIYLLQADYFSSWNKDHLPVLKQAIAYRTFPPLYPFYFSIIGAGSNNIVLASAATSILLLPISILYVDWQIKNNIPEKNALLNALLFLLMPATLLMSTELWSENLYLLLVFLTIWFLSTSENDSAKKFYLAALVCGLVFITRTVGISLIFALLITVFRRDRNKVFFSGILIFIPWLIWKIFSNQIDYSNSYFSDGIIGRYSSIINIEGELWSSIINIVKVQLETFWLGLQLQYSNNINNGTFVIVIFILLLASFSFFKRILLLTIDSIYILFYLFIIFVWYYPDHNVRFLYVLAPFLLYYSQLTLCNISEVLHKKFTFIINYSLPVLLIIVMLPSLTTMYKRFFVIPGEYITHYSSDRLWLTGKDTKEMYKQLVFKKMLIESAVEVKKIVSEDECIYSMQQELLMLYSQRKVLVPPSRNVSDADFISNIKECRYMMVIGTRYNAHEPLYPVDRVKDISWVLQQKFFPDEFGGEIISALLELDHE